MRTTLLIPLLNCAAQSTELATQQLCFPVASVTTSPSRRWAGPRPAPSAPRTKEGWLWSGAGSSTEGSRCRTTEPSGQVWFFDSCDRGYKFLSDQTRLSGGNRWKNIRIISAKKQKDNPEWKKLNSALPHKDLLLKIKIQQASSDTIGAMKNLMESQWKILSLFFFKVSLGSAMKEPNPQCDKLEEPF